MSSRELTYLLLALFWGWQQIFVFAGTVNEKEWIKKHHGIIFYQDYSSDRYDLVKLTHMAKDLGTDMAKTWIKGKTPGEILQKAKSRAYKNMFDSFKVMCLNVCPEYILIRWDEKKEYSVETRKDIQSDFYQLTRFLIENYDGQGKTFIINYFFEINVYMGTKPSGRSDLPVLEFIGNAQAGVKQALSESLRKDIRVLDCIESNCDHDYFTFVKDIFPKAKVDLYSLSFYGTGSVKTFLTYWTKNAPDNALFRDKNVIIGEYGIKMEDSRVKGNEGAQEQYLKSIREQAKDWNVPYIFLFWLADQESKVKSEGHFGLVDVKGHKREAWRYLHNAYRARYK